MFRTMIDLDDVLVADTTKRATVNGALAEFVAVAKRRRFVDLLEEGVLDDLSDPEVMAGAWRWGGSSSNGIAEITGQSTEWVVERGSVP
jgi:hypothetical protein